MEDNMKDKKDITNRNLKGELHGYTHRYFNESKCNDKTLERAMFKNNEYHGYFEWHNHTTTTETCYHIR